MERVTQPFKVAAIEFNPQMFELEKNIDAACAVAREAAQAGARLIVLPEAAVSGYIYRDLDQFKPYMDAVPGKTTDALAGVTADFNCYIAIGIAEIDRATGLTYNTGALVGPNGYIGKYRKNGLNPSDILWFTPGNTGYPVFETELGNITMVICYDDTYWEPGRLPAIKGADLIAYICSSDRVLTQLGEEAKANHSTIAAVQHLSTWNGLAMVAADRNNAESNPTTGVTVTYGGCASVWQATGERIAHSPATNSNMNAANPGQILYAEIDPSRYANDQRATLQRRRPELYGDLAFYRAPTDNTATTTGIDVSLVALQYQVVAGEFDANLQRAETLIESMASANGQGVIVLPAFSFAGLPSDDSSAAELAETSVGRTVQALSDFAVRTGRIAVGSYVEKAGTDLYHTCAVVSSDGRLLGQYRQTHLDPVMTWARPGDQLMVFETPVGRLGVLSCEDLRFPEASGVLATKRADIIAVPTYWDGSYGAHLQDAGGLFAHQYPPNTMNFWYAAAKTAQAYTVVANSADDQCRGSSGIFSINPVDSDESPVVAPIAGAHAVEVTVKTLGSPEWFMNQARLIAGRRADLAVPAVLDPNSDAFTSWRDSPGYAIAWGAY